MIFFCLGSWFFVHHEIIFCDGFYHRNLKAKNKHLVVVFMFLKVLFLFFMLMLVQVLSCSELLVNPLLSWITMVLMNFLKLNSTSTRINLSLYLSMCHCGTKLGHRENPNDGWSWGYQSSSTCGAPLLLHGIAWIVCSLLVCAEWFREIGG